MKIYIRVDASLKIGTGHVMRCLTLAEALRNRGADVNFICRDLDGNLMSLIAKKGFNLNILKGISDVKEESGNDHSHWLETSWQNDAEESSKVIEDADWLIIDHYALDKKWEQKLRAHTKKVMVIDDLADREHDCDLLLDQNYYAGMYNRYNGLVDKISAKLLGPEYALLRPEFAKLRKGAQVRDHVANILVFFGGIDSEDSTGKVAEIFQDADQYEIDIIVGGAYSNESNLDEIAKNNSHIKVHQQAQNMAELMSKADIAIGSGGSASWERCALGLPTIGWPIANNQIQVIENLVALGVFKIASEDNLYKKIGQLTGDELSSMSKKAFVVCDGKGAAKVANHIMLSLREAGKQDSDQILEIRNHELVRENSFNSSVIKKEDHEKWYEAALENDRRIILVAESDNKVAGVLRYDINEAEDEAEISIYLDPKHFGLGYSKMILQKGERYLKDYKLSVKKLTAKIVEGNNISKSLFISSGYAKEGNCYIKKI